MSEDATTTLLLHAAREGDVQCVRELIRADDEQLLPVYKALVVAVELGHKRVVRYLLEHGADANTVSDEGRSMLELAAGNGHTNVAQCLIQYGAGLTDASSDVWTPLVLAIENGHEETARYLVEHGADVNSTDHAGRSMLTVAVDTEQEKIVNYLVSNGAGVQMPEVIQPPPTELVAGGSEANEWGGHRGELPPGSNWSPYEESADEEVVRSRSSNGTGVQMPQQRDTNVCQVLKADAISSPDWWLSRWEVNVDEQSDPGSAPMCRAKWLHSDVAVRKASSDSIKTEGPLDPLLSDEVEKFKREARQWFRLNHPHVAQLFGACCDDTLTPIFVYEHAVNGSLDEYLKTHPQHLWTKLHEVALGVQYLHERNIVLGGLRCSSVVVGSDLKVKLTEFGQRRTSTTSKKSAGDGPWVAPELLQDRSATATLESDIFALGVCVVDAMRIVEAEVLVEDSFVVVEADEEMDKYESRVRSKSDDASDAWVEYHPNYQRWFSTLPDRPATCTDDQWSLVEQMCARNPRERPPIAAVVRSLEWLQLKYDGRQSKLEQDDMTTLGAFDDGKLSKRWSEAQSLAHFGLQQLVLQDFRTIFSLLHQSVHPRWLLEEVALLLSDFVRDDRFLRCRVLDASSLRLSSSMRVFGQRIDAVLRSLGFDREQGASDASVVYSYRQIDFLVSEELPAWLLLSDVVSDGDYSTIHSLLKAELFGNSYNYTFDQLVVIRSAYEEINEVILLGRLDSLTPRPRWFVRWGDLRLEGWGSLAFTGRAKWLGANVTIKRLDRINGGVMAPTEMATRVRYRVDTWFSLSHPNVVRLYGACHVGDRFLVCEGVSDATLTEYLRGHPTELWPKLLEVARGVAYLHARGIVHGHLGGASIVIAADGMAKVTDVGISSADGVVGGSGGGTGDWKRSTFEADVFSLGVCVAEALRVVSAAVEDGDDQLDAASSVTELEIFLACDCVPSRPKACRDNEWGLVEKMCASNPIDRIRIDAVVDALETLVATEAPVGTDAEMKRG